MKAQYKLLSMALAESLRYRPIIIIKRLMVSLLLQPTAHDNHHYCAISPTPNRINHGELQDHHRAGRP